MWNKTLQREEKRWRKALHSYFGIYFSNSAAFWYQNNLAMLTIEQWTYNNNCSSGQLAWQYTLLLLPTHSLTANDTWQIHSPTGIQGECIYTYMNNQYECFYVYLMNDHGQWTASPLKKGHLTPTVQNTNTRPHQLCWGLVPAIRRTHTHTANSIIWRCS